MLFSDYIKDMKQWDLLPDTYKNFFLMDILHMNQAEIDQLTYFEFLTALHYCTITYQTRSMGMNQKKGGGTNTISFSDVPPDWDHDPNFTSVIPPR